MKILLLTTALFIVSLSTLALAEVCSPEILWGPYVIENGQTLGNGCYLGISGHTAVKSDDITFTCDWDSIAKGGSGVGKCKITKVEGTIYNEISGDNENGYLYTVSDDLGGAVGADSCIQSPTWGTYAVDSQQFNAYKWSATGSNNLPVEIDMGKSAKFHVILSWRDNSDTDCSGGARCVVTVVSNPYILGSIGVYYKKCCPDGYELKEGVCKPKPEKPDLLITSITQKDSTIYYTIKNQGQADIENTLFKNYLYIDEGYGYEYKDSDSLSSLKAGEEKERSFSYSFSCPEDLPAEGVKVKVCADATGNIPEENEENNCLETTFCVCDYDGICEPENGENCANCEDCACPPGYVCENGRCVEGCKDECTEGERKCDGSDVYECKDCDGDGCTEWCYVKTCGEGYVCENGQCVEAECESFLRSIDCPSYVQVNNPFTISWTFYYGEYCSEVCIEGYKDGEWIFSHGYSYSQAGDYTDSEELTAPSENGTYTYTLKLKGGINCGLWDGSNPDSTKSCTIEVVKDTTPPEYETEWEELPC